MDKKIRIEYCTTCNYRPIAAGLALRIKEKTGLHPELIGSRVAGAFEVFFGEVVLHSKMTSNAFPETEEVVRKILGSGPV